MKLGKIALALAALMMCAAPVKADEKARAEVFVNNQGVLGELKASAGVGDQPNVRYFGRARFNTDYHGATSPFLMNELSVGDLYGFRAVGQARFIGPNLVPYAGLSYSGKKGDFSFFSALTSTVEEKPTGELFLAPTLQLSDEFSLEGEVVTWANGEGVTGTTRGHVAYEPVDNLKLGVAGELDYGNGLDGRVGGFVRMGF